MILHSVRRWWVATWPISNGLTVCLTLCIFGYLAFGIKGIVSCWWASDLLSLVCGAIAGYEIVRVIHHARRS